MRQIVHLAADFLWGMLAKSRLILIVTVLAIFALIWVDRVTRGTFG
jgi:hypothetical protein